MGHGYRKQHIYHDEAIELRNFLNRMFPSTVDVEGRRPAAESAAEATPDKAPLV